MTRSLRNERACTDGLALNRRKTRHAFVKDAQLIDGVGSEAVHAHNARASMTAFLTALSKG